MVSTACCAQGPAKEIARREKERLKQQAKARKEMLARMREGGDAEDTAGDVSCQKQTAASRACGGVDLWQCHSPLQQRRAFRAPVAGTGRPSSLQCSCRPRSCERPSACTFSCGFAGRARLKPAALPAEASGDLPALHAYQACQGDQGVRAQHVGGRTGSTTASLPTPNSPPALPSPLLHFSYVSNQPAFQMQNDLRCCAPLHDSSIHVCAGPDGPPTNSPDCSKHAQVGGGYA